MLNTLLRVLPRTISLSLNDNLIRKQKRMDRMIHPWLGLIQGSCRQDRPKPTFRPPRCVASACVLSSLITVVSLPLHVHFKVKIKQ